MKGFLGHNLLSNSVSEEVKTRRLVIGMNATKEICDSVDICRILDLSSLRFDQVPQSIQIAQILTPWCHIVTTVLLSVRGTQLPVSFPMFVNEMTVGLRSLMTNMACRNISSGTTSPMVTIVSYFPCNIAAHDSNATDSRPTQLDDANDPSPNPSPFESRPTSGGSTDPQHIEETNILPGPQIMPHFIHRNSHLHL